MFITVVSIRNYNEKWTMDSWSKQTQTNPISESVPAAKIGNPTSSSIEYIQLLTDFLIDLLDRNVANVIFWVFAADYKSPVTGFNCCYAMTSPIRSKPCRVHITEYHNQRHA
jgi:hypothetical protein